MMFRATFLLLLFSFLISAQKKASFLENFTELNQLKSSNELEKYNQYNFSKIWMHTESKNVLGVIDTSNQRIKIKLLSIEKNPQNPNEYKVRGKSMVKDVICDFSGIITLFNVQEFKSIDFGVDNEHKNAGIQSEGLLKAVYVFYENESQKNSGVFQGVLYSKWFLDADNKIQYDNLVFSSDAFSNNAFVGIWTSYTSGKIKICNWADYRVPNATNDLDIGAAEFIPNEKYFDKGWESYYRTYMYSDERDFIEENRKWWEY